jgi:hypothetical protein
MLIPIIPLLVAAAILMLSRHVMMKPGTRALWRSSVAMGSWVGVMRAGLACLGWYGVEHTGGPLQSPAFALALLAWPEGLVLGRGGHRGPVPLRFYPALALLRFMTSMVLVSGVALLVQVTRWRHEA